MEGHRAGLTLFDAPVRPGAGLALRFFVAGEPVPQGSMRAWVVRGRARLTSDNPALRGWRERIAVEAQYARARERFPYLGSRPITVRAEFVLLRPRSLPRRVVRATKKPDLDKLGRAVLDALTAVVFNDDAQVDVLIVSKRYGAPGETPGAWIDVEG